MRKTFSKEFKAKVALEALKGDKTIAELASEHKVHATQITAWRKQLKDSAAEIFGNGQSKALKEHQELVERLYKNVGQLQVENDWMRKNLPV
jgi:transposase-like protein